MRAGQLFGARPRRVFCDVGAYVSCRGYVGIPLSAQVHPCECKVAPRIVSFFVFYSSLTDVFLLSGTFFILHFIPGCCRAKAQAHPCGSFREHREVTP